MMVWNKAGKWVVLLLLTAFLIAPVQAFAQSENPPVTDDQVNAVAKQLYCPVCENIPLDVCGTQACQQWRDLIREKLGQGWSEDQIKAYFVQQYGDRVLAEPPRQGLNWLVYLVPPLAFLLGVVILVGVMRSWKASSSADQGSGEFEVPTGDDIPAGKEIPADDYVARFEDELRRSQ
jgi:cytochrome c-type biogenesis protein CcmH